MDHADATMNDLHAVTVTCSKTAEAEDGTKAIESAEHVIRAVKTATSSPLRREVGRRVRVRRRRKESLHPI